ncbi:MAG TPA: NfeD family protein [Acidimicrobiia bacterium]|nr:NfeD family protein [Acidimicrobiia bacterium]
MPWRRFLMGIGGCALVASSFSAVAGAQNVNAGRIDVVQVNGLIDPAIAALIRSSLRDAARLHSTVVVFQLDASGAVDVDVDALLHDVTHSAVPVAIWVGPSGGGARGAAALLARSAAFSAVAPGAHLGPVDPIRYDKPSFTVHAPLKDVTEKAATLLEFIGLLDGRTLQSSTGPVTLSTIKVVQLNGKQVREPAGEIHFRKLGLVPQLAHTLDSPWVAYFLFVAGLALIVFEFFSVGVGVAGFVGAVALIGGCFGFSHLPLAPWAVALLLLGMLGMSIDIQAGTLGAWTFIGAASLVAGSIWLFGGSSRLDPTWWVLVVVIGSTVLFMLSGMTAMVRSRFSTPTMGREDLVGEMGLAEADVDPDGVVRVRDALWRARTNRATPIHAGDPVRVVSIEGVVLEVEPESGGARDHRERRRGS